MSPPAAEWFDRADPTGHTRAGERGLRFSCTLCGNCCTGPSGYVLVADDEIGRLASRLGIEIPEFIARFTRQEHEGRSLTEKPSQFGYDCVFLDRDKVPGRAVCGVYEDRPAQCRSWPFWPENLKSRAAWERASTSCPGMNTGTLVRPDQIRIRRDSTPGSPAR
ncbi:MAG: YkgJ family cysteine cluster protein [Phycisphaeraceae bacterium]|nr:YkgJ family cysteine cluster protein [Phycisphaeraceae bacterium]